MGIPSGLNFVPLTTNPNRLPCMYFEEGPTHSAGIVASVMDAATDAATDYATSAAVIVFTIATLVLVLILKSMDDESARRGAGGPPLLNPDQARRALRRLQLNPECLVKYIPPKRQGVINRNWKPAEYRLDPSMLPSDVSPVLAFVNSKSGGRSGKQLLYHLRSCLNASQVVDLSEGGPEAALEGFCGTVALPRLKILVCGGDGTVNWVLDAMGKMRLPLDRRPPVAILPLGTGNDLARVLGWGSGSGLFLDEISIPRLLASVDASHPTVLDRWMLSCSGIDKATKKRKDLVFNNYFGLGVDSVVVHDFHQTRNKRPDLFVSQILNKAWYAVFGAQETLLNRCADFKDVTTVKLDGKSLDLPHGTQGIIIVNIESYAGGANLWTTTHSSSSLSSILDELCDESLHDNEHPPASMQDGLVEVVAVMSAFHLGQIQVGLAQAVKLGQARSVEIETTRDQSMQVDGEPWVQPPGKFSVTHHEKVFMCQRSESSASEVQRARMGTLSWALKEHHISRQAYQIVLQKMSADVEAVHRSTRNPSPSLAPAESSLK